MIIFNEERERNLTYKEEKCITDLFVNIFILNKDIDEEFDNCFKNLEKVKNISPDLSDRILFTLQSINQICDDYHLENKFKLGKNSYQKQTLIAFKNSLREVGIILGLKPHLSQTKPIGNKEVSILSCLRIRDMNTGEEFKITPYWNRASGEVKFTEFTLPLMQSLLGKCENDIVEFNVGNGPTQKVKILEIINEQIL